METDFEIQYYKSEEKNWWFVGRRHAILKILKKFERSSYILDIGCGGGALLADIKEKGFINLYGIDISEWAISRCMERGLENIYLRDGQHPGFPDDKFDLVILSDVLEHFKDDENALNAFYKIIKPGGKLLVFVPSFPFLWSKFDEVNHHFRRYKKSELVNKLMKANFSVEKVSFWNFLLFFPAALMMAYQKITRSNSQSKTDLLLKYQGNLSNKILIYLLRIENYFFNLMGLPIGISLFAISSKKTINK